MHVLIYSDDPGIGGVAQFDHMFSLGLVKAGFRAGLVQTDQKDSPQAAERVRAGVEHHWLNYNTVSDFTRTFTNLEEPAALFDRVRPDFILFSDSCPVSNYAAKRIAQARGIPYAARVGFVAPYLAERFASVLTTLGELYEAARAVVAVSRENLGLMERLFRLPPHRGRLIYSGKSEPFFRPPDPVERQRRRESLGIPQDGVLCFTAARLEAVKGYQYQMAAIERLRTLPVWDRLFFAWAGPGALQGELEGAIAQRGLTGKVHLLGQCWDVPAWLDAADIFVLPAQAEGLPQAVMEAMAKRLPVVSTRVSGIPEALADTGVLLPDPQADEAGAVAGLVRTLADLATDTEARHAMGEACFRRADRHFRAERMVADFIALIAGPASGHPAPETDPPNVEALLARHALPLPGETRPFHHRMGGFPASADAAALSLLWERYRGELTDLRTALAARRQETAGLGLPADTAPLDGELLYVLLRECRPELVYGIGCAGGEAAVWALAALTRNGRGRIELFEAAAPVAGLPVETALRCRLVPGCDAALHHLNRGDPRRAVAARPKDETPDFLIAAPPAAGDPDSLAMAEWLVKAVLPRVGGPAVLSGVLRTGEDGAPRPEGSDAALYLLSWMQHAGVEPLALALHRNRLSGAGASALVVRAVRTGASAGTDEAMARLLDGNPAGDVPEPRFLLTSERVRPGSIRSHRWEAAMPPEDRLAAVRHGGIIDRNRIGVGEVTVLAALARAAGGAGLPAGLLAMLADRAALFDPHVLGLLREAVTAAGDGAAAERLRAALTAAPVPGSALGSVSGR